MAMNSARARARADEVRRTSLTVLEGLIPVQTIDAWNAAFTPLLQAAIAAERDGPNRGPARHYVTLPFRRPWADPAILDNDDIWAVVAELVGEDAVLCQLASDTPSMGSDFQDLHRDAPPLFLESGCETPPFQLAVNFPLVDVTAENGPMEWAPGSHMVSRDEGIRRVTSGETPLQPALMKRGDVMIRDVRHIHRGTPNRTAVPRPMIVLGFSRRWLFRPEVSIRVDRCALADLPARTQRALRYNPLAEAAPAVAPEPESYRGFAY